MLSTHMAEKKFIKLIRIIQFKLIFMIDFEGSFLIIKCEICVV